LITGSPVALPDSQQQLILEEQGATVVSAASAEEVLAVLAAQSFDAVVSPLGMPGMNGYEMIRRIRACADTREVPAIALTAYARAEDRAHTLEAGYQAHLTKPVDAAEVIATLADLLSSARARGQAHTRAQTNRP
jgi:CheY-like chemotaxis protein